MAARMIHEMRVKEGGDVSFAYFARIGGNWVDLAPWGNRPPHEMSVGDEFTVDGKRYVATGKVTPEGVGQSL